MTAENPLTQKFRPYTDEPEITNFEAQIEMHNKTSWTGFYIRDGLRCITLIALGVAIALESR